MAIDDQRPVAKGPLDGGSIDSGPRFRLLVERSPDVFLTVTKMERQFAQKRAYGCQHEVVSQCYFVRVRGSR